MPTSFAVRSVRHRKMPRQSSEWFPARYMAVGRRMLRGSALSDGSTAKVATGDAEESVGRGSPRRFSGLEIPKVSAV